MDLSCLWPFVECLGVIVFAMGGYPCCCRETINCQHCENQIGPLEFSVEIAGVVNGDCDGCADVNGTYIVTFVSFCQWNVDVTIALGGTCSPVDGTLTVTFSSFDILVGLSAFPLGIDWIRVQNAPHDCFSQGINIPFNQNTAHCDASGSTCTIAAVP